MSKSRLCAGALLMLVLWSGAAAEAQTVFVVRHAERTGEPDPPLNADGKRRAESLARTLADAGVEAFFASDTIRAQETAQPTATRAGRKVEVIPATEIQTFATRARKAVEGSGKAALIVGHRSSVPELVKALGGGEIPPLRADEHDRLVVVTLLPGAKASVATLRYPPHQ